MQEGLSLHKLELLCTSNALSCSEVNQYFGIPSVAQISPKVILTLTFKKQKALDLGPITLVGGGSIGHKRIVPFNKIF